ncbi:MAG: ATP-dependent helicase HrpB [Acidimicrobiales bacterium]|nr:MAG: ATP-dependent helicase HrpB [Acidimicrobiales bacterium]
MGEPTELPVDAALPRVNEILAANRIVVLESPPGTGKTTRVPPSLVDSNWLAGQRVLMLEPRRVAARAAAERIAADLGSQVGDVVGVRTRFDTRIGPATRLEVVTEGVLSRMLIDDPALEGVGAVIFDEFHERSIHADTALAFTRETRSALRPDLRLVLMSATIDGDSIAAQLGEAEIVRVESPLHPVQTSYRVPAPGRSSADDTADAIVEAVSAHAGDVLVFLAGVGDINRTARALGKRLPEGVTITPLHGSLPPSEQDRALRPAAKGVRKVVLSTPIAETSVTIDGVRIVIDTGRRRRPETDIGRGMSRLRTVNASQAATDQRRGRAGRQGPGICIRLWPEVEQGRRRVDEPPEILTADLTSLALQIAAWGAIEAHEIPFVDPPPAAALAAARGILTTLGALDDDRRMTAHGREMVALGAEPRLAHMMIRGHQIGLGGTACDLAAVLADRDLLTGRTRPTDLRLRVEALDRGGRGIEEGRRQRARDLARRWRRRLGATGPADLEKVGAVVSLAYPDRLAQRRADAGSFLLASGAGVATPADDGLAQESYLAVAETDGMGADARIITAAPIDRDELEALHADRIEELVRGEWDRRSRDVAFERQERLGALVLRRSPDDRPDPDAVREALLAGVRREGLGLLSWSEADRRWRERLAFLHRVDQDTWPDVGDGPLTEDLETWLGPAIANARRRADLEMIDVKAALNNRLDWRQIRDVERLAPTHIAVPSGSRIPVDYSSPEGPVLAVRLQEMFGLAETPTVANGSVTLVLHLLSPAHRPVQVTSDLDSFWSDSYQAVRKELRGRYPKHEWPEDPTSAAPTSRAKRRR